MGLRSVMVPLALVAAMGVQAYPQPESAMEKIRAKDLEFTKEAFLHAIRFNRNDDVRWFVAAGMDIDQVLDEHGNHAIHIAANDTRTDTARLLLALGADPNETNDYRYTALHYAVRNHATALLRLLIHKGADVDAANERGRTALHIVAERGHVDTVRLLIRSGAEVDARDGDGRTPLLIAVRSGRRAILAALVKAGADLDHTGPQNRVKDLTPLAQAIRLHDWNLVSRLIRAGADVNATTNTGFTPLMIAYLERDPLGMSRLLAQGARVDDKGGRERTLLQRCLAEAQFRLCDLLMQAGARFEPNSAQAKSQLRDAVGSRDRPQARYLLGLGVSPDHGERLSQRPLTRALGNADVGMVELLIDHGAEANWRDPGSGNTAAFLLGQNQLVPVALLKALLRAKLELNVSNKRGVTPLMVTATTGSTAMLRAMIGAGAAVDVRDPGGWTALMMAARAGRIQNVAALLEAGADPAAALPAVPEPSSGAGRTAYDIAKQSGNTRAAQLIVQATDAAPAGPKNRR